MEHSAILLKLPFAITIFVLSICEWPFYTGFTVVWPRVKTQIIEYCIIRNLSGSMTVKTQSIFRERDTLYFVENYTV